MLLMGWAKEGKKLKAIFQPMALRASHHGMCCWAKTLSVEASQSKPALPASPWHSLEYRALLAPQGVGIAALCDGGSWSSTPMCKPCVQHTAPCSRKEQGQSLLLKWDQTCRSMGLPLDELDGGSELPTAMGNWSQKFTPNRVSYSLLSNTDVPFPTPARSALGKRLC